MNSPEILYSSDKQLMAELSLSGFFVGWPKPPSEDKLKEILRNSQHIQLAIHDKRLIGFINAVSDQALSAYIPLLEVLPAYQGHGIGSELVTRMKEELKKYYMIDICCDEDVLPFYEKLGFKQVRSVSIRNYHRQSGI